MHNSHPFINRADSTYLHYILSSAQTATSHKGNISSEFNYNTTVTQPRNKKIHICRFSITKHVTSSTNQKREISLKSNGSIVEITIFFAESSLQQHVIRKRGRGIRHHRQNKKKTLRRRTQDHVTSSSVQWHIEDKNSFFARWQDIRIEQNV